MSDATAAQKEWFGHPRGLSTLFFTEFWERFSFYGMRAILLLFMLKGSFEMEPGTAGAVLGLYLAGGYMLSLPGGWVADRLIGQRSAVFIGGCVIAAGHFSIALPLVPGLESWSKESFYAGLILLAIGTGLLKPNVSASVGDLYPEKGAKRDAGFLIFYMGINAGAWLGPILCGYLGEKIDWHLGFSAAGFGMIAGLIQYKMGGKYLGQAGILSQEPEKVAARRADWKKFWIAMCVIVGVLAILFIFREALALSLVKVAGYTTTVIVVLSICYFASVLVFGGLTTREKKRVLVIFLLFLGAALFWSGFEQASSSLTIFAEDYTDRTFFGWEMPTSWTQSFNAFFIVALAPVFASLWLWMGTREPSIPVKFGIGLAVMGTGFLVLAWGATYVPENPTPESFGGLSISWLVIAYFLHTCGELCLSPVGLSSITKLAPPHLVGQMMGTWFMGASLGNIVAAQVGARIESYPLPLIFGIVAAIVIAAGSLFVLSSGPVNKLIGDFNTDPADA
jgi:POT family proton-dependent oligopeptide transporter